MSQQLFWVAATFYQAASSLEKLLYNLTLKLEKLRIQLRKEIVRVGGVCSKTNANHPTWLSHVMLASSVPTLASIFTVTWSLGPQKLSSTIKDPYSTSPLLSWTSNQWPLTFWCLVSSCTLVLLSSNHPRMLFSVCPLIVWSSVLQDQRTHCFSGFLIFRTDTNVSRYLLKLWSVYSKFPGLLVLLSSGFLNLSGLVL